MPQSARIQTGLIYVKSHFTVFPIKIWMTKFFSLISREVIQASDGLVEMSRLYMHTAFVRYIYGYILNVCNSVKVIIWSKEFKNSNVNRGKR